MKHNMGIIVAHATSFVAIARVRRAVTAHTVLEM